MQRSLSVISKLDAIHKLVTDEGIPPFMLDALKVAGVEVIIAN
jgi:DeoR/GlpR family transcriptional regulator of sugar metabolism